MNDPAASPAIDRERPAPAVPTLEVARIRLRLESRQRTSLPPYLGSTLRGALASALRRQACVAPGEPTCERCAARAGCGYARLFETPATADSGWLAGGKDAPRPLVLEPPPAIFGAPEARLRLEPGTTLAFHLVLIGRAVPAAPVLVAACRQMAEHGLGADRSPFGLLGAECETRPGSGQWLPWYDGAAGRFVGPLASGPLDFTPSTDLPACDVGQLALSLRTPLRLVCEGHLLRAPAPEFHELVRAALRRTSALALFHGAGEPALDAGELVREARQVQRLPFTLSWVDWSRLSNRQGQHLQMGGLLGTAAWSGPVGRFVPLLRACATLHLGKGTIFGLGRYSLQLD